MAYLNSHRIPNKLQRQAHNLKVKKEKESTKRDERLRRRRHEDQNPELRERRRAQNVPATIDKKRTWDAVDSGDEDGDILALRVDILDPKRRKTENEEDNEISEFQDFDAEDEDEDEDGNTDTAMVNAENSLEEDGDERDSMLDTDSENDDDENENENANTTIDTVAPKPADRASSEAPSTATDLTIRPEALKARFPSLFDAEEKDPKVLLTTSINSTLHQEAQLLTSLFPNSTYIRRTAHFHGYKYSLREISAYASSPTRGFTHVVVLNEERKKPRGLDIVHLPHGPTFHFSLNNWVPGARIPGHGNPTDHLPELILNGFRTPLGLLTAHLFKSLFPTRPDIHGRQVVTLHAQRDYIFLRRHRYIFRDKRSSEKMIQDTSGKPMKGVEDIRAGLQELGPRFTLKLRRVDKGIQRASGQEWEWKAHDEKVRTRFSL